MVPAKDFKRRMVVEIDGAPHMIEHIQVQTPSARGAATLYKIKARNLKTKLRVEKAYRGTDGLPESSFERRPIQFLYRDPDGFHFMDSGDFNQFSFPADELREQAPYMTENMEGIESLVVDDEVIAIELPDTVEMTIVETAPGVRGNSATGRTKPATPTTGHIIQVPEHLDQGVTGSASIPRPASTSAGSTETRPRRNSGAHTEFARRSSWRTASNTAIAAALPRGSGCASGPSECAQAIGATSRQRTGRPRLSGPKTSIAMLIRTRCTTGSPWC